MRRDFGFQGPRDDGRGPSPSILGFLRVDGGVRAKAEILNPFQRGVGFIPGKSATTSATTEMIRGKCFINDKHKHLGTQFGSRVRQRQSYAETPGRSPAFGLHLDSRAAFRADYRP